MSILVNFYSANRPDTPDGHELDILGAQVGAGELVDDASNSSIKDVDMIVTIRGVTTSWVRIGSAANADECEKVEAGECIVRFLPAGQSVYCDVASTSATDVGLLTDIEATLEAIDTRLSSVESILSTPASSLPPFELGLLNRFTPKIIDISSSAEANAIVGVTGDTIRVHYFRLLTPVAANELAVWNGPIADASQLDLLSFAGAGAGHTYGSPSDPIWVTSAGKGLVFKPTGTARITGLLLYKQD